MTFDPNAFRTPRKWMSGAPCIHLIVPLAPPARAGLRNVRGFAGTGMEPLDHGGRGEAPSLVSVDRDPDVVEAELALRVGGELEVRDLRRPAVQGDARARGV